MVRLSAIFLFGASLDSLAGDTVRLASSGEFPLGVAIYLTILLSVGVAFAKTLMHVSPVDEARERKRKARELSLEEALAQIRAHDPGFDPDAFLVRASQAYRAITQAWNQQDFAPVRSLVSDAVYERYSLQFAELKRRGIRDVAEDLFVEGKTIAQVDLNQHFQTITVRIRAAAKCYREDTEKQRVVDSQFRQSSVEYCSFLRKPGAATRASGGLLEGNCPNCGTPLRLNETGICGSCGAKVWSGRYDWVLTEVTEENEWHLRPHDEVPGVAAISHADPAFCLQQLHDRVSAMFWRRITAWQAGDVTLLRNMATAGYCQALADELAPDPDGTRCIPAQVAVGSVATEGILCEPACDQALVRINWSSGGECLFPDGKRQPVIGIGFRTSFFLLKRKHGAQGSLDDALSSSHCRGCGAPVTASCSAVCEHCGIPLVDVDRDWLLAAVYFQDEPPVLELLSHLREMVPGRKPIGHRPASGRELVAWMVRVMVADDKVEEAEQALLEAVAAKHGVAASELEPLIAAARAGELDLRLPGNAKIAREWLATMAAMAQADGKISEEEKKVIQALGKRLGLSKQKTGRIISGARTRRFH